MTFKLAQYIIDFAIYKLEMEGIQIMTKRKIGEGGTFLQA